MKKVILHVGIQKTATSSIQQTLFDNKKLLGNNNIFIPYRFNDNKVNHSYGIHHIFCNEPEKFFLFIREGYEAEMLRKIKDKKINLLKQEILSTKCSNILLSAESISLLNQQELINIKSFFEKAFDCVEFQIIIVIRNLISIASSIHQQNIKDGSNINIMDEHNFYKSKIKKFIDVFGYKYITIYKFEDSLKPNNGPVEYFLDNVGVNRSVINEIQYRFVNESISANAMELIEYINLRQPYVVNNILNKYRDNYDLISLYSIRGNKYKLNSKIIKKIYNNNLEDINWLNSLYVKPFYKKEDLSIENTEDTNTINYNKEYYEDVIDSLSEVSNIIKRILYDFFVEKSKITEGYNKNTCMKIIKYLSSNYYNIISKDIEKIYINEEEQKIYIKYSFKDFSQRSIATKMNDIVQFCVNIATICEQNNQFKAALYFMEMAKINKSYSPYVTEKIALLKKKIEE